MSPGARPSRPRCSPCVNFFVHLSYDHNLGLCADSPTGIARACSSTTRRSACRPRRRSSRTTSFSPAANLASNCPPPHFFVFRTSLLPSFDTPAAPRSAGPLASTLTYTPTRPSAMTLCSHHTILYVSMASLERLFASAVHQEAFLWESRLRTLECLTRGFWGQLRSPVHPSPFAFRMYSAVIALIPGRAEGRIRLSAEERRRNFSTETGPQTAIASLAADPLSPL